LFHIKELKYYADDRFVVKEMMNIWNVSEKDAFLKFAPKYFDHLKKSTQVQVNLYTKE
jgi:hypothetical protein